MVNYIHSGEYNRVNMHSSENFLSNPIENEVNIFRSVSNCMYKGANIKYNEEEYKSVREEFEEIQSEQGFIGQNINKLKNKIPISNQLGLIGSDYIENILLKYENDEISEFKAREAVHNYGKNQKILTDLVLIAGTIIIFALGGLLMIPIDISLGSQLAISVPIAAFFGAAAKITEKFTRKSFKLKMTAKQIKLTAIKT